MGSISLSWKMIFNFIICGGTTIAKFASTSTFFSSSAKVMFAAGFSFKESQPSTSSSSIEWSQPCHHFKFDEIVLATNNFDEALVIGHGGFGKVYKGNLINGSSHVVAAIKRLDSMSGQGAAEFWAEIETLSYLRHCNLVSLFGYCNYDKEMILVYEYVPNRTLADHLHKLGTPLSWLQRLKICIGAGRGLHYLHTGAGNEVGVIHRDVKTSNILLNESWAAKISDFGLSKIGPTNQPLTYVDTRVKGTFGYLDPDYSFTGRLTRKSDVYAFGVILLEVLCRKPALDLSLDDEEQNLARWAQEFIKEGKLKHIIDSGIRDQISTKCLKEFVRIAGGCLNSKQKQRPTMAEVVFNLESILDLQEKMKSLLHPPRRTIFGRLVDKLPFTSNVESSGTTIVSLPSNRGNSGISNFTGSSHLCRQFKFHEILLATDNFDESLVIGRGRFGKVYKGNIMNGSNPVVAALKRLDPMCRQGASEFWAEVEMLSRFHHCNLASLIGYCNDEKEMILIYEYISKGTLSDHLHKLATPLSWLQRLEICIDVARGLDYLHTGDMGIDFIIHRNVKTSEILLHESWAAKISGFGLSKRVPTNQLSVFADLTYVSTSIKGTFGYLDPDYFFTGRLTRKTDVYAFGVVLLEVLCRKRAIGTSLDEVGGLARWAQDYIKEGNLKHIIDSDISDQISSKCLKKFVQIAEGCLHNNPKQRPTMAEVVVNLESILTLQEKMNSSLQLSRRTIFGGMAQH